MALAMKMDVRLGQQLVMTPQLLQAIKLLQLSSLDLAAYVDAELERNPLLEREDADQGPVMERESAAEAPADGLDATDGDWAQSDMEASRSAIEERLDTDLSNEFPDDKGVEVHKLDASVEAMSSSYSGGSGSGAGGEDYNLEEFVSKAASLADHLEQQLAVATQHVGDRLIGHMLIDAIDDCGYLTISCAEVAEKLACEVEDVEAVLGLIQAFEPTGVGARNLAECLALQLKEQDRFDPVMEKLVGNLDLLAKRDFASLRRICGCDEEDMAEMVKEIRHLNPKPGLVFGTSDVQTAVPDVTVRTKADGSWAIELVSDSLPRVLVNQTYAASLGRNAKSDADKSFVTEALANANWLTRALEQRATTILKVATEIVRQQDAFFALGVQYLRPLNLKTIADAVGMHESTISRVTSNKFMATPRGLFEMRYFFTAAIQSAEGGDAHSSEAVRHRIKGMIDLENPRDILSDDTIVDRLREDGIDIARRTVAKYREAMRIPSSVQRRREKQAMAV